MSHTTTAADLARHFGHWRDESGREPVFVTSHGRVTHVLLALPQYEAMKRSAPEGDPGTAHTLDPLHALADWVGEAVILVDADLRIAFSNRVARALCGRMQRPLSGEALTDALPELSDTLIEGRLRRTVAAGEPGSIELPSPFRPGAWLRCDVFPFRGGAGILLHDVTVDVVQMKGAQADHALANAIGAHGEIAALLLSPRGYIEQANSAFATLVGLPVHRLSGIAVSDIIDRASRASLRDVLESVLRGDGPNALATRLLSNSGALIPVQVAAAPLAGGLGASLIMTRLESDGTNQCGTLDSPDVRNLQGTLHSHS